MEKIKVGDWVRCPKLERDNRRFTPGKMYEILEMGKLYDTRFGTYFRIRSDEGEVLVCNTRVDSYIEDKDWEIVTYESNLKEILE